MNKRERQTYLQAKLRNLKRKSAKISMHAELIDEYMEIDKEIKLIEKELQDLQ